MEGIRSKLPVGIENFAEIRTEGFYYIDKTGFIRELLQSWGKVNLFTRPRRFGKTLNMDMLKHYFEIGTDPALFEGLEIIRERELCGRYMGNFPVISISLKEVEGNTFENALQMLSIVIRREARRFQFLLESTRLTEVEKESLRPLYEPEIPRERQQESLMLLSEMLYKHYDRKVIILIDEYDVPLEKAWLKGYYDDMVAHIRSMFSFALKTNDALYFAVLTGCLRVSRESIFTGLNNFSVHSISDTSYDEYFGFTDDEVRMLLKAYGMSEKYEEVRAWYDGYRFGKADIYCPWDVLTYVKDHLSDMDALPRLYWANSSENSVVRNIIERSTNTVRDQIETLINGGSVKKELVPEMTYKDLEADNQEEQLKYLWTMLYSTGYLTDNGKEEQELHCLTIPNREVLEIFRQQAAVWFSKKVSKDKKNLEEFFEAVKSGKAETIQKIFNLFLRKSISIRDTAVRKEQKESFYHGVLLGILGNQPDWIVRSNAESGDGYSDILIEIPEEKTGCVIEVKYAENQSYDKACHRALQQIREKRYADELKQNGIETVHLYGIACWKKECRIVHETAD